MCSNPLKLRESDTLASPRSGRRARTKKDVTPHRSS